MEKVEVVVAELIWDDWNIDHILTRHNVTPDEVYESLGDPHLVFIKAKAGRVMSLGRAGKRLISTVLQPQDDPTIHYVVTARDMARKERRLYRQQKGAEHDEN